jgi:hypothetical protein
VSRPARQRQRILGYRERERAEGLDANDAASRWLTENAPAPSPAQHAPSQTSRVAAGAVACRHAWATIVPRVSAPYRYCLGCGARRDSEQDET